MNKKIQEDFIYVSEEDFNKYFWRVAKDPLCKDGLESIKEGGLYKLKTNNKIKNVLGRISRENHVTIDKAFVLLMRTADMINNERDLLDKVTSLYRKASKYKQSSEFDKAKKTYKDVISLCAGKIYLNQRKGGAYFHLADMARLAGDNLAVKTYLKLCLKFDPHHKLAQKYAMDIF